MGTLTQSSKHSKPDRLAGGPKQYIRGWCEFYKLKFKITHDVLIPRPETELLVDEILKFYTLPPQEGRVNPIPFTLIDVGTGCGNIAISIAKNRNGHPGGVHIIATDISKKALKVAKQNAKLHGVQDKIEFVQSDLLNTIASSVDIIVSNLPYIPSARIPYLEPSVKDHEPLIALDGGPDGFDLYRKLFQQISKRMHNPGLDLNAQTGIGKLKLIVCEIDYTQGELAVNEAQKYFPDAQIEVKHDLAKKQRILVIQP